MKKQTVESKKTTSKRKSPKAKKLACVDLFCGCGGLTLGLHKAGIQGLFAIEKSVDAFETLKFNLIDRLEHFRWPNWLPLFLEGDKTHQNGYSADDFKQLRVQLMALSEELEPVIGKL